MNANEARPCSYEDAGAPGRALTALLSALRAVYDNGGVLCARVRAVGVDSDDWFLSGTFLEGHADIRGLFDSRAVRQAMPELQIPSPFPLTNAPRFSPADTALTLDGELAAALVWGGAYLSFQASAAEAKRLAMDAVDELVRGRYEAVSTLRCEQPWTPWFFDVAWDRTWVILNRDDLTATIICTTDTD